MTRLKSLKCLLCIMAFCCLNIYANNSFSDSSYEFEAAAYPSMKGNSTQYEWIEKVQLGTLNHPSGNDNGYADFTANDFKADKGARISVSLTPGFSSGAYSEYWKVWIDYNQDSDFADQGEEVFSQSGNSTVSGSFTVPSSALNGNTRVRIAMNYNTAPPANGSGTMNYGEVEDYTITISGNNPNPDPTPDVITFADANLEQAIRDAINKPSGDIYAKDLEGLTTLNAGHKNIKNLGGIEHCKNLTYLKLIYNSISDISLISHLTRLDTLYICYNQVISDLSPLSELTTLTHFEATSNNISDISPLQNLTGMTKLELDKNKITDITPLQRLTKLNWIDLNNNSVRDLSPLEYHRSISMLDLEYNNMVIRNSSSQGRINLNIVNDLIQMGAQVKYKKGNSTW